MALDTADWPKFLQEDQPPNSDSVGESNDHIKTAKRALKNALPNVESAVSATGVELSYVSGATDNIQNQIDVKAPITAPVFISTIAIGDAVIDQAELEILDGATLSTTELNTLKGITTTNGSTVQQQLNGKSATSHVHTTAQVTGLDAALLNKYSPQNPQSDGITKGSNGNGYWTKDSSGLIRQWGRVEVAADFWLDQTFPIPFVTLASISITAGWDYTGSTGTGNPLDAGEIPWVRRGSTSSFQLGNAYPYSNFFACWQAIGY